MYVPKLYFYVAFNVPLNGFRNKNILLRSTLFDLKIIRNN